MHMPGANRLTLHVLAAAAERERHMIGERTRHALAAAEVRGVNRKGEPFVVGNTKQAKQNKTDAMARAEALRAYIECCINAGRTSSSHRN